MFSHDATLAKPLWNKIWQALQCSLPRGLCSHQRHVLAFEENHQKILPCSSMRNLGSHPLLQVQETNAALGEFAISWQKWHASFGQYSGRPRHGPGMSQLAELPGQGSERHSRLKVASCLAWPPGLQESAQHPAKTAPTQAQRAQVPSPVQHCHWVQCCLSWAWSSSWSSCSTCPWPHCGRSTPAPASIAIHTEGLRFDQDLCLESTMWNKPPRYTGAMPWSTICSQSRRRDSTVAQGIDQKGDNPPSSSTILPKHWKWSSLLASCNQEEVGPLSSLSVLFVQVHLQHKGLSRPPAQPGTPKTAWSCFQSPLVSIKAPCTARGLPAFDFRHVSVLDQGSPSALWLGNSPAASAWKDQASTDKRSSWLCLVMNWWGTPVRGIRMSRCCLSLSPGRLKVHTSTLCFLSQLYGTPSPQRERLTIGFCKDSVIVVCFFWLTASRPSLSTSTSGSPALAKMSTISCGKSTATFFTTICFSLGDQKFSSWIYTGGHLLRWRSLNRRSRALFLMLPGLPRPLNSCISGLSTDLAKALASSSRLCALSPGTDPELKRSTRLSLNLLPGGAASSCCLCLLCHITPPLIKLSSGWKAEQENYHHTLELFNLTLEWAEEEQANQNLHTLEFFNLTLEWAGTDALDWTLKGCKVGP